MRQVVMAVAMLGMSAMTAWAQSGPTGVPPTVNQAPEIVPDAGIPLPRQAEGKIVNLDRENKALTLDDGTRLVIPKNAHLAPPNELKEGSIVKATYETQNGQKVVTSIEVRGTPSNVTPEGGPKEMPE